MGASGEKTDKSDSKSDLKNEIKQEIKSELDSKNDKELEVLNEHKPVPLNIANKVMKAICKIIIKTKKRNILWNRIFYELFILIKMPYDKLSSN